MHKSLLDFDWNLVTVEADEEFTRFNNERGLRCPCVLQERRTPNLTAFLDKNRSSDSYYNRIFGITESTLPQLDELSDWFRSQAISSNLTLPPLVLSDTLLAGLHERGYRYSGADWVFVCDLPSGIAPASPAYEFEVELVSESNFDEFLEHLTAVGTKIDPTVIDSVRDYYLGSEFENYVVRMDGAMVASASIFFYKDIAWLSNANTLEAFRNLGCQGALLSRRCQRARERQCKLAFTDAEFGGASHRNILSAGFDLAYVTCNMRLAFSG